MAQFINEFEAVFLSDAHLFRYGANADQIISLLDTISTRRLYLVGDFIDLWALPGGQKGEPQRGAGIKVIEKIFKMAEKGTEVTYVIGNHDDMVGSLLYNAIDGIGIPIVWESSYSFKDKTYLVTHGDMFDPLVTGNRILSILATMLHHRSPWFRRLSRAWHWWIRNHSLQEALKEHDNFASLVDDSEIKACKYAYNKGFDGVICGHTHDPFMEAVRVDETPIAYFNCGDWLTSNVCIGHTKEQGFVFVELS